MEAVNSYLPTPPPTPSPLASPFSLSERINAATRPAHTQLNRLILARLPLALPPHTTNPSTYISGILHIAPIYATFESLWGSIIDVSKLSTSSAPAFGDCDPSVLPIDATKPENSWENIARPGRTLKDFPRTDLILSHLRLPELLRAERLRDDIRRLTSAAEHKIDEQLKFVSQHGKLADFTAHITKSVNENPHVLLAYAWVLYMALFSGGRYLRASLSEAGGSNEFWTRDPSPVRPYTISKEMATRRREPRSEDTFQNPQPRSRPKIWSEDAASQRVPGLQFFDFVGTEDGEDIKFEFKKRFAEVEALLTECEREDIIREAQHIFEFMIEMVAELDSIMETSAEGHKTVLPPQCSQIVAPISTIPLTKEVLSHPTCGRGKDAAIQITRRSRHLQDLFKGPVASVTSFKEGLQESTVEPLTEIISGAPKRRASIDLIDSSFDFKGLSTYLKGITTALSFLALMVVFVAWYRML